MALQLTPLRLLRYLSWALLAGIGAFLLVWVLFWNNQGGLHAGGFAPAVDDPQSFYKIFLDSIYISSLYFVVASGFTLIFGLMRVVNMAYGSFFLLGGYLALRFQYSFMHIGPNDSAPSASSWGNWVFPLLIATAAMMAVGVLMQQLFLRWNQGQELRQALITIAISLVLADQLAARLGVAKSIAWPGTVQDFVGVGGGVQYPDQRLFVIGVALLVGAALWVWLRKTRMGMVIRAGVDDRHMVSALGVNVQWAFAVVFAVGSGLAALGGVMQGSQANLSPGTDSQWLLFSLVVVIIGGMGSLVGAGIGALIFGIAGTFAQSYLPSEWSNYAIIATFVVLAAVLAARPYGIFGRPE